MGKINIAKLLKSCPTGMELNCTMYEDVYFDFIDVVNIIHCYIQHETHKTSITFNQHGTWNSDIKSKCVIFPKGKTTWEGFHRPFEPGDIVITDNNEHAFIYSGENDRFWECFCGVYCGTRNICINSKQWSDKQHKLRLATEKEKEKLFQVIKDNGYEWNNETKTLEKVEPKFKDGDVLHIATDEGDYSFCIVDCIIGNVLYTKASCSYNGHFLCTCKEQVNMDELVVARFVTEEEKQILFDSINKNGYKWNSETKTLEKVEPRFKVGDRIKTSFNTFQYDITGLTDTHYTLVEVEYKFQYAEPIIEDEKWELVSNKFDISTLTPFDKVLVRCSTLEKWRIQFFEKYDKTYQYPFICIGRNNYKQCIPYEGNEHLHDKTDDCQEFYKNWSNEK